MDDENNHPTRVLVVDDDFDTRHMVVHYLEGSGMRAVSASGRQDAARHFARSRPSVVILDLVLGQDDGLEFLREIRSRSDVPVIIVSGHRCGELDRAIGLELGADDYITKPFGLRELLARIGAVLRRRGVEPATRRPDQKHDWCTFSGWKFDRIEFRLTGPHGAPVALTNSERSLLMAFLDAPQRPLSREQLMEATRKNNDIFERSVDGQILRLRRKLEIEPSLPRIIQTKRGVGYVFTAMVEQSE